MACCTGLSWLPIVMAVLLEGTALLTDTGVLPPESCIFSMFVTFDAVIVAFVMSARYRQIAMHLEFSDSPRTHTIRLNQASLVLVLVAALGISIVANFQATTMFAVHGVGTLLAFGIGTVYFWTQAVLSFLTRPGLSSSTVCVLRVIFCVLATVTVFPGILYYLRQGFRELQNRQIGAGFEWALSVVVVSFFLTYINEFKRITVDKRALIVPIVTTANKVSESSSSFASTRI